MKKYENYELKELVKTDKTKEEDGREFVYYDAVPVDMDIRGRILSILDDDNDISEVEGILLSQIKSHLNIQPLWKPSISEEEYEKMLEIERQEAIDLSLVALVSKKNILFLLLEFH